MGKDSRAQHVYVGKEEWAVFFVMTLMKEYLLRPILS